MVPPPPPERDTLTSLPGYLWVTLFGNRDHADVTEMRSHRISEDPDPTEGTGAVDARGQRPCGAGGRPRGRQPRAGGTGVASKPREEGATRAPGGAQPPTRLRSREKTRSLLRVTKFPGGCYGSPRKLPLIPQTTQSRQEYAHHSVGSILDFSN